MGAFLYALSNASHLARTCRDRQGTICDARVQHFWTGQPRTALPRQPDCRQKSRPAKIEKGRYFTLNAARQTGKTTIFREVMTELEAEGKYFAILLSFETLSGYAPDRFYERLSQIIQTHHLPRLAARAQETLPDKIALRDHGDFGDWLPHTVRRLKHREC
jgi:hypothetical protein